MKSHRFVAAVLALSIGLAALPASAAHTWSAPSGEPTAAARQEAKALYIAGNRAVEQGRWSDALVDFEKSYALSGVPAALFNVATTLRALGRHVESRDAFAQLLAKHKQLDPDVQKQAETMLAEEKARVASLIVADLPSSKDELTISLDGKAQKDAGDRPLAFEVDPGKHALRVEQEESKPFTWEGTLADGEKKQVAVKLVPEDKPAPTPTPTPAPKPEEPKSGSVWSSPIFWTAVGVVVVGAAAGAYFYDRSKQLEPGSGVSVKP